MGDIKQYNNLLLYNYSSPKMVRFKAWQRILPKKILALELKKKSYGIQRIHMVSIDHKLTVNHLLFSQGLSHKLEKR